MAELTGPSESSSRASQNVHVYRENLSPNTMTLGRCIPALEALAMYRQDTAAIIAELDTIIAELCAHRERLRETLL